MKKWLCALLFVASPSFANTFSSDFSDLWWNANESGWGVTVTQQQEVVFLTFFVYGVDGRPVWYTGQGSYASVSAQGGFVFTGQMYQTTGPWLGSLFNTNQVTNRPVGTLTFTAFLYSATLAYTIDGVTVNKSLTRQTFRNNSLAGEYMGTIKSVQSGCRAPFPNGDFNRYIDVSISHFGSTVAMTIRETDGSFCNYSGNYTQGGKLGRSQGTTTCSSGATGTYDAIEIEAGISGLIARFNSSNNFCTSVSGRLTLMKK